MQNDYERTSQAALSENGVRDHVFKYMEHPKGKTNNIWSLTARI